MRALGCGWLFSLAQMHLTKFYVFNENSEKESFGQMVRNQFILSQLG